MKKKRTKQLITMVILILSAHSSVQAQTPSNNAITRNKTIQKGNVLHKKATPQPNRYNVNNGTKTATAPKHPLALGAPRTQPIVTKPLPPVQNQ